MTRREALQPTLRHLREVEGLKWREIADRLGISIQTAHDYYTDPLGEKARARKSRNDGICLDCGEATKNSGARNAPDRCRRCALRFTREDLGYRRQASQRLRGSIRWTEEDICAAIRSVAIDGYVTTADYDRAYARAPRGSMPSLATIATRFDLWSRAVAAAGCHSRRPGGAYSTRMPDEGLLLALQECAYELGRPPTYGEYEEWSELVGAPGVQTVRNRFDGWWNAIEAAFPSEVAA